ncbi:uncharacterized protein LOC134801617 [Cydia splendana]|uniref:uncharacterized protein LOC134801617 n=1 Tax=Cydia splendana TaxID=1100963 RepID=UPI00300D6DF9
MFNACDATPCPQKCVFERTGMVDKNGRYVLREISRWIKKWHKRPGLSEIITDIIAIRCMDDSPLCRACMEAEETAAHVILECPGVAKYRAQHLGSPGSLPEVVGNIKGLLGFLVELGWQE